MEIIKSWIIGHSHLVLAKNGQYYIGETTNVFRYEKITKKDAQKLITGK